MNLRGAFLPTDIITLYIPVTISNAELANLDEQIGSFEYSSISFSPGLPSDMVEVDSGWGLEEVDRGEKGVKMMVHVLLHTWHSKDVEFRYKSQTNDAYDRLLLKHLREAERLGVEWDVEQVLIEPVDLSALAMFSSGGRRILEKLKRLGRLGANAIKKLGGFRNRRQQGRFGV